MNVEIHRRPHFNDIINIQQYESNTEVLEASMQYKPTKPIIYFFPFE